MIELLSCPFCGEPAELNGSEIGGDVSTRRFYVTCACGSEGPWHPSSTEAAAAWNRRATPLPGKAEETQQ